MLNYVKMIADSAFSSSPWQLGLPLSELDDFPFVDNAYSSESSMSRESSTFGADFDLQQQMEAYLGVDSSVTGSECSNDDFPYVGNMNADSLLSFCNSLEVPLEDESPASSQEAAQTSVIKRENHHHSTSNPQISSSISSAQNELNNMLQSLEEDTVDIETDNWCLDVTRSECLDAERTEEAEELSNIICSKLGPREQIEVLRMIDPESKQHTATNVSQLDLENLNEELFQRVKKYVDWNQPHHDVINDESTDSDCCDVPRKRSSNGSKQRNDWSRESSRSPPTHKRKTKKQRRERLRVERERQEKEARQVRKERRSGLFRSEQVLSLSRLSESRVEEAEEEVDIIT